MRQFVVRLLKRLRKIPQPEGASNPFAYAVEDTQAWSIGNWLMIPEADRRRCLEHLGTALRLAIDGPAMLGTWRRQVAAGRPIGSNDGWFHFGTGMVVRNWLRDVMIDDKLPPVRQPNGEMGQNWDDFYQGALHALVWPPAPTLLDRLHRWANLEIGEPIPPDLAPQAGWGEVLSRDLKDAIAEIERLRSLFAEAGKMVPRC